MATKRAMEHLVALVELGERVDLQTAALVTMLKQVIIQADAVTNDGDQEINEVISEKTTGKETTFTLGRGPVKPGSVVISTKSGKADAKVEHTLAGNVITLATTIPEGCRLTAQYVVLGLQSQTEELVSGMSDLDSEYFQDRKQKYLKVIQLLEDNS